jgi:hypothetical protein
MNKIRNPRQGLTQKYFNFLVELKARIHKNPKYPVNDLISNHKIGGNIIPALKQLNVISGDGRSGRSWNGNFPDHELIYKIRVQIKKNTDSRLKQFNKFKPSDLFHPVSGKQMGVGNFHHFENKPKVRKWTLIKSFIIFKRKFKIYKIN